MTNNVKRRPRPITLTATVTTLDFRARIRPNRTEIQTVNSIMLIRLNSNTNVAVLV